MTNQLLNVEKKTEPQKEVGQGSSWKWWILFTGIQFTANWADDTWGSVNSSFPNWAVLQLNFHSNQILSKLRSCPVFAPKISPGISKIFFPLSRFFFYRNWAAAASTSTRHTGQHLFSLNQLSTQETWNRWMQARRRTRSPSWKSVRQITQLVESLSSPLLSTPTTLL